MLHKKVLGPFIPGRSCYWTDVGSLFSKDIISTLTTLINTEFDTIVLCNGDVWRYFHLIDYFKEFSKKYNKKLVLITLGYNNIRHSDLVFELSFPMFYWTIKQHKLTSIPSYQKNYYFSCLNNKINNHRIFLGCKLYEHSLIGKLLYSQNTIGMPDSWKTDLPIGMPDCFNDYLKLLPIKATGENNHNVIDFSADHTQVHPAFLNTYCNIVTESECEEWPYSRNINLEVITEKSYKPLLTKQIPIYVSGKGHLKYLTGLGFNTFFDLLPDNYDSYGTSEKINSIINLIKLGNEYIESYYFDHIKEIEHNYNLIHSDKVETIIIERIKKIFE